MNHNGIFSLSFPEAKTIIVSGDIHGNFNQLVFKLCIQYQLTDTLLIVAGDCGFGFEKKEYYEQIVRRNAKRMNQDNNWIVFVRGNHDNPAYFDGAMLNFKRFVAVPDYSILQVCFWRIVHNVKVRYVCDNCINQEASRDGIHLIWIINRNFVLPI